jgi:predicted cupin superfamily sugar epimerase
MDHRARWWIRRLGLHAHPEGGWYCETYRAGQTIPAVALPPHFHGDRVCGTAIYYLLAEGQFSHLHRLRADEIWHLYDGGPLILHLFDDERGYSRLQLGTDARSLPQAVVTAGTWFGASCASPRGYALVGCTMAPGFEFADFELADRADLLERFPGHAEIIESLTGSPDVA